MAYALSRGHTVSTFTRGKTKPTIHSELFDQVEQLIGDREDNLKALENRNWDLVIDNSGRRVQWTRDSAQLLKDHAERYLYTSSTGVYYPYLGDNIDENTQLVMEVPTDGEYEGNDLEYDYGVMKANSEQEAIKAFGKDRAIVIRPTYMLGPADSTNRFLYWPLKFARGGNIVVPGKQDDPVQYIDVRDVAEWMVRLGEEKKFGTYNAVGPAERQTITQFVNEAKDTFGEPSVLVRIDDYDFLKQNELRYLVPWIMPEGNNYGTARINNAKAKGAGLTFRDLKTTVGDVYEWWTSTAVSQERRNKYEASEESILNRDAVIIQNWESHKEAGMTL